jgi:hypothetical protein
MEYSMGSYTKSSIEKMQTKAIEKAKQKGANAVLFQDYYLKETSASIQTTLPPDSIRRNFVQTGSVNPIISSKTEILFLKYD